MELSNLLILVREYQASDRLDRKTNMQFRTIALILAACMCTNVHGQELSIGSLSFSLGKDRAAVMRAIKERFEVVTVTGQPDTFFVSERKRPHVHVIGGVAFKEGRLAWVQRNWGAFEGRVSSVEVSKALFNAIESASSASQTSATISTKIQRVPGSEFKTVTFEFPTRRVTMTTTDGDARNGGSQVSIEESIRLPQ